MSCILTDGYSLGCRDNIGGIQEVYIGDYNGPSLTYLLESEGLIGTFSGATTSFYTFEQEIEAGSYTENGVFSVENGTAFYEQTLQISLHKMDAETRNKLLVLGQGKWRIIIKDQRGKYWLMGYQNPVRVSEMTPGLGKAYGDMNGATITFMGKEPEPAVEIKAAALVGGAATIV
jgi:hypothetical protein